MTDTKRIEEAANLAKAINEALAAGRSVVISNHLRGVKLSKKHAGAVSADGAGIRIYRGAFWPLGSFSATVSN